MMSIVNFDNGVCAMTDKGLVRDHNEDSNRVTRTPNGDLFVVCDGMGGHAGGATASRIGVDSICQYASENTCDIPQQFLTQALKYANAQIYAESRSNPELAGMGTTACVALVRDNKVWYAHVGDSRIYYYNAKQKALFRLTKDHSVVQALVDCGEITEAEAEHHPEKNKIRKSLGIKSNVEPEPCQMPLMPAEGDMMLICSDGLSGMMDEEDMLEVLTGATDVNVAGKVLIDLAKSGGGTDNITVQIIRFTGVGTREAVFDPKNKGVSLPTTSVETHKKRLWPWIVIAASVLVIVGAVLLLVLGSPKKEEPVDIVTPTQTVTPKDDFAYKTMIPPGAIGVEFVNDRNKSCVYYNLNNGEGLILDSKDYSYQIGVVEAVQKDGRTIYQMKSTSPVKKYKRDGSPIN